jgi:hypothetical protein
MGCHNSRREGGKRDHAIAKIDFTRAWTTPCVILQIYDAKAAEMKAKVAMEKAAWAEAHPEGEEEQGGEERRETKLSLSLTPTATTLPLARVKRIAKLDPSVRSVGTEAAVALAAATECFIEALTSETLRSFAKAPKKGSGVIAPPASAQLRKRLVTQADITRVIHSNRVLSFLKHDFPLDAMEATERLKHDNRIAAKAARKAAATEGAADGETGVEGEERGEEGAEEKPVEAPKPPPPSIMDVFAKAAASGALIPKRIPPPEAERPATDDKEAEGEASISAKQPTNKSGKTSKSKKGNASKAAAKPNLLAGFVKKVSAEEAREQAEARLAAIKVNKKPVSGKKRKHASNADEADRTAAAEDAELSEDSEGGDLAAIRARASGKPSKPGKKGKGRSAAALIFAEAEEEEEAEEEAAESVASSSEGEEGIEEEEEGEAELEL